MFYDFALFEDFIGTDTLGRARGVLAAYFLLAYDILISRSAL